MHVCMYACIHACMHSGYRVCLSCGRSWVRNPDSHTKDFHKNGIHFLLAWHACVRALVGV